MRSRGRASTRSNGGSALGSDLREPLRALVRDLETVVPYAAALHKRQSGLRINVNRMQEAVEPEDPREGLVITLWNGRRFSEYATNDWTWNGLREAAMAAARRAMQDAQGPASDIDPGEPWEGDFRSPLGQDPDTLPLSAKLSLARERRDAALGHDPQVVNAISVVGHTRLEDTFVNRAKAVRQTIVRSDAIAVVYVSDGKNVADVHGGLSKNGGLDAVAMPADLIPGLVADAKRLLGAERLKPGTYDVVTDPEWSGIIAHECFGHGMETDLYVRERALSRHYIGKPVASNIVNMFDDPSITAEAGGFFFDDEGAPSRTTHIIKDGILQRGLTDLASAHRLGLARSANGRRESFARKAYARMTNTFFGGGKHTPAEMIRSVRDGLYLRHATNGMEDPQAWGIQVEGLWAEEIKDGRLTGRVFSPVIMTGFVPDLLKSITMVGNDPFISGLGMCGKGHKEWVKNTTGGPHLRMTARLA